MKDDRYQLYEEYMLTSLHDSAHDSEHVYRVLHVALDIAAYETGVDMEILTVSCLLHDIGRKEEREDPQLCHAVVGADKAFRFLQQHNWETERAARGRDCIAQHRYRNNNRPDRIEAKILFDADKLDAAGAVGIARTLIYKGMISEPIYTLKPDGTVSDGDGDVRPSFFKEYKSKLEKLYDNFYTERGRALALSRKAAAESFYNSLLEEVRMIYNH